VPFPSAERGCDNSLGPALVDPRAVSQTARLAVISVTSEGEEKLVKVRGENQEQPAV